jgi:hypothetical protein
LQSCMGFGHGVGSLCVIEILSDSMGMDCTLYI